MGWSEVSIMSARREFVKLATQEGANVRELCRRHGISPTTAYKWMARGQEQSETYEDRSRRPLHSPNQTDEVIERKVLTLRDAHPFWNARKIRRLLAGRLEPGQMLPAASTIGQILKRNGRISEQASAAAQAWQRFEHEEPNDLSQIDFKGHFTTGQGECYPLTIARRPLTLLADPEGVYERANRDRQGASDRLVSAIRPPETNEHGQRQPVGEPDRLPVYAPDRVVDPARHRHQPLQTPAPADQRKGRAISPNVEGRAPRHGVVRDHRLSEKEF